MANSVVVSKKNQKKTSSKTSDADDIKSAAQALLQVQLSGAILSVVADFVAKGNVNARLSAVLEEAEARCKAAAWRKYVESLV